MANAALDGSVASGYNTQQRYGGAKRRIRDDDSPGLLDVDISDRVKLSRHLDGSDAFDLEAFGAPPSEVHTGTSHPARLGGIKRSRSPLDSPSCSDYDSPELEPGSPARREKSSYAFHPKRARDLGHTDSADTTSLVPIKNSGSENRLTSGGSRIVLWLDKHGRISAVARNHQLSSSDRLKPIVRIPHIDLADLGALNLPSLLERTALVPRHTANTFLTKAASWLARHMVWNLPERHDPVQNDEFSGSGVRIELLDEDPRSQFATEAQDDLHGDIDISGRRTPGSPVTLLGGKSSSTSLDSNVRQFVGMDFSALSAPSSAATAAGGGGSRSTSRPRAATLGQAIATRDDPLHDTDNDEDIVLGVEVDYSDLPVLARALQRQFPASSSSLPGATSTCTAAAGVSTRPCGQLMGSVGPVVMPHAFAASGPAAVRLPMSHSTSGGKAASNGPAASRYACQPQAAGQPAVGVDIDSDGDADL